MYSQWFGISSKMQTLNHIKGVRLKGLYYVTYLLTSQGSRIFLFTSRYEILRNFTKRLRIYEILTNLRNSYEITKFLRNYEILTKLRNSYESIRTRDHSTNFLRTPTNRKENLTNLSVFHGNKISKMFFLQILANQIFVKSTKTS